MNTPSIPASAFELPAEIAEKIDPETLESVIARTRRLCDMLQARGEAYDARQIFENEARRNIKYAENAELHEKYRTVMRRFGKSRILSTQRFAQYQKEAAAKNDSEEMLHRRIEFLWEQGWKRGTLVEPVNGHPIQFTIAGISIDCRLGFEENKTRKNDSTNTKANPLNYRKVES
jgi:hypothetical protein